MEKTETLLYAKGPVLRSFLPSSSTRIFSFPSRNSTSTTLLCMRLVWRLLPSFSARFGTMAEAKSSGGNAVRFNFEVFGRVQGK